MTDKDKEKTKEDIEKGRKEIKEVGNYKATFKVLFDKGVEENILLNIKVSQDVLGLINEVVLDEKMDFEIYKVKYQRYKVKSWLYNSLYSSHLTFAKDLLFITDFIENGEITVGCENVEQIDGLITDLKTIFKEIIRTILKYHDYQVVVDYSVKRE